MRRRLLPLRRDADPAERGRQIERHFREERPLAPRQLNKGESLHALRRDLH
ncbi:hypothetical protein AB0H88_15985 [Nonomuraea sp. NPDC050680]|uniref:hypothetical protein n=1 Tax=Nonomuraea sp. NPDC050680 TaxID=3154630 RepID=UPI0033C6EB44